MLVGDHFAGRLRELRSQAGMSQQQLAAAAGLAVRGVTYLESGQRRPSWDTILAICQALGVECTAFTQEPAEQPAAKPGRPRKAEEPATEPKKKPRKKKGAE